MYGVRFTGWLEVLEPSFERATELITHTYPDDACGSGEVRHGGAWLWMPRFYPVEAYILVGTWMSRADLPQMEELIARLAQLGDDVTGYFFAQGEDCAWNREYRIVEGRLITADTDRPLIDYAADGPQ